MSLDMPEPYATATVDPHSPMELDRGRRDGRRSVGPMNRCLATALAVLVLAVAPAPPSRPVAAAVLPAPATAAVKPVLGAVLRGFDPPRTRFGPGHRGVDLQASGGEPVVAALGGTVTFAGRVAGVGWVSVDHGAGLKTTYGPIHPRLVETGDVVAPGSLLGLVAAEATHLDWGAKLDGAYIDPLGLLRQWETFLTTPDDGGGLPVLGGRAALSATTNAAPRQLLWPASGRRSSGFGLRVHPVTGVTRLHAGLDIAAPTGEPIRAAAAGRVSFVGGLGGYGTTVMLDHGGGMVTVYAHQSATAVSTGKVVAAGDVIGSIGATGVATGPHLHFEVRVDGTASDPIKWLRPDVYPR